MSEAKTNIPASQTEIILERIFLADDVLPNAADAFCEKVPSIENIINHADIVLDTNVLLLPYGAGSNSLDQIIKIFNSLAKDRRLFLPAQTAREFLRNRPTKLAELQQQINDKISKYESAPPLEFPILEGSEEYEALKDSVEKTKQIKKELLKSSKKVIEKIKSWEWSDPVHTAYQDVFNKDTIIQPEFYRNEVVKELKRRQLLSIPPGYKDASKEDLGIGDYLIWLTILSIGKNNKKPLVFISGDEKADWQHRYNNSGFLPRFELMDEFRRASSGQPFFIIPLSKLLELKNVEQKSITEIKLEEERIQEANRVIVECPNCEQLVSWHLADHVGASALPACNFCHNHFHMHRTKSGVITNTENKNKPGVFTIINEDIPCPSCNATNTIEAEMRVNEEYLKQCPACHVRFALHLTPEQDLQINHWYTRPKPYSPTIF